MKINMILAAAASAFLFAGCYDLDKFPNDQLSSGTFWKTQEQFDQGMAAIYNQMQNNDVYGTYFGLDCLGSIGSGYDGPAFTPIGRGTYAVNEGTCANRWSALYEGVARANLLIQNIDKAEMSEELKTRYAGEAKFMRALYYSQLLDFWGGVPIYDETVVVSENFSQMLSPRSSASEVREFILNDLDAAIASLPAHSEWSSADHGRATKGAAQALKGKVFLYAKQYAEAAAMFETVVKSGQYSLYPSYEDLFKPGGDDSDEMIFAIQNIGGVGQNYGVPTTFYMGTRSSYGSCWDNVTLATDFVDTYEWKDGRPFDWEEVIPGFTTSNDVKKATFVAQLSSDTKTVASYPEAREKLLQMYEDRDPRMSATAILPYTMYKGWVSNNPKMCEYVIASGTNETNGFIRVNNGWYIYLFRKFVAEHDMDGLINNRADTPINFPIIRYADVLLMLAECYNEQGKQSEAVELVNQVRARVGMPGLNSGPDRKSVV